MWAPSPSIQSEKQPFSKTNPSTDGTGVQYIRNYRPQSALSQRVFPRKEDRYIFQGLVQICVAETGRLTRVPLHLIIVQRPAI